ncbi:NAD(P)-binding domain-containing protein [Pararhizobium sp. YC-54]|uniref:NAD(P)-binding domain-containing protein n=1 Tax=Pararhizobium sp. YC-54 TaxID=2986920 RepID=UPI0021F7C420|nr:NAD(P)-binding domain-containing protein [Pararhizobium sp. YC-54]MCV9999473.1 NAD(P)-binding domain-containing protein [Pararhizobium sp. YC-54]
MTDPTLGVIGTGDFAAYFISALRNGGHKGAILLSPYSRRKAAKLADDHGCVVAEDEDDLLNRSQWLLLAVRPEQLSATLPIIKVRAEQVLLSAVAGLPISVLRTTLGTEATVVRVMPSSYVGVISGGLFPIYPSDARVEAVLAKAGKVLPFETEDQFELSMIGACLSGWMYRFMDTLQDWFVEQGLSAEHARDIVAGNVSGAAANALTCPGISLQGISDGIATDGTYTKLGLDYLLKKKCFAPWSGALAVVHGKLQSTS